MGRPKKVIEEQEPQSIKIEPVSFNEPEIHPIYPLIESAIQLKRVVLHGPVIFLPDGMPETAFYDDPDAKTKPIPGRQAKIWYTPSALIIEQRGRYKILHPVQIKDSDVQI